MYTFTVGEVIELMGVGAFGSLSAFFWVISSITKYQGDEYGTWFGYMLVLLFGAIAFSLMAIVVSGHL